MVLVSLGSFSVEVRRCTEMQCVFNDRRHDPGYSFKTNQYGLTVDTVQGFELVLPDGTATNVTESTNPDLFWALKVRSRNVRHQ